MANERISFDLSDRVAIVTGGNGGIGLAIALGLASAGAMVVVAARAQAKAEAALSQLADAGTRCAFVSMDVQSSSSIEAAIAKVVADFGRVDILVNNAGISVRKLPEDLSEEDWNAVITSNLSGPFLCCKAVFPHMRDQGAGKIINIGSMYSQFGAPKVAAYAASKGGVVQLTRALATAWAIHNIQVNTLLPGWHETDLTSSARQQVEGLHERVLARTPAGRWGLPSDLAGPAVFLASPASDFVTGATLAVDGGFSISG